MSKPWFDQYDPWVPHEIGEYKHNNVVEMLLEAGERFSEKVAFSNFGATMTYAEVLSLSRDFAAYLQNELGIRKGDRVALMAPNMMVFPIAMLGILRAGGVQVNVNPMYTARELEHQLNDADTDTIIIFSGSTGTLAEVIDRTSIRNVIVANLDDLINLGLPSPPVDPRLKNSVAFLDALSAGASMKLVDVDLSGDELIFLQYTGGTTGLSKGAMLTHRNLVSNIMQFECCAGDYIRMGEDVVITAIPMYHIFALMVNTLSYFKFGGTNVLITNPRDMPAFVKEWSKWKVTVFAGVNTLYNGLLHTPGFADLDFSSLGFSVGGGAAVQKAVSDKWKAVTGKHIKEGYGLSETSPILTINPFGMTEFMSSIGVPAPSTDISLRDDEGNEVPQGERGELCAKGPQVMKGYWRREDATAEVMTDDGYFRTGDIAVMDESGFFRIVDRKKDMIIVSGFNVFPNEIEAEIAAMDGVLECACIGVPDEKTGEAAKVFIVKSDEALTREAVREYCKGCLTAYKIPRQIVFIDELPKSTVGKILRRELREM
ncbi:MAG: AMP-binding protein [Gammaproteobacteria bacterium]|nr:AMP-binding protein [Gammaproteobacteria bacterium]